MSDRALKILALATYPERSAATRFRLTQLLPYMRESGWEVRFDPFVDEAFFDGFYQRGGRLHKGRYLATRSIRRLLSSIRAGDVDAVFIQRASALIGPPYSEFILGALKGLPIIFDFDDAIWHLDLPRSHHPVAAKLLKAPEKCWYTMRASSLVIAGSSYLGERAREVNDNVLVVPTTVDADIWVPLPGRLHGEFHGADRPVIGWVGSHTTAHQLELVEPALQRLRSEGRDFELRVVGADEDFDLPRVEVKSRPWRLEREIRDFQEIDIGLAPMHSEPVYQGKCGFKQLQYMAVGVPFVSSWVGGAKDFVVDGENGLVANDPDDWYRHLRALLDSHELRARLARGGRAQVESRYCIAHQAPRVIRAVEEAIRREPEAR